MSAPAGAVYNVGSDDRISIGDLAYLVRDILSPNKSIIFAGESNLYQGRNTYVPDISRAKSELGLSVNISLRQSIGEFIR